MSLCCCEYLVIVSVQLIDDRVNILFNSYVVVVLVILYWADIGNERPKVIGGPIIRCLYNLIQVDVLVDVNCIFHVLWREF